MDPNSAIEKPPKVQEKINQAIESIMPEAQEDPELYKRVVKILQDLKFNRDPTWSDCELYKGFRNWAKMTSETDRMKLDTFIACDAAHKTLSIKRTTDYFSLIAKERKLRQWAVCQIRAATFRADEISNAKMACIKQERVGQGQENSKLASEKPAPARAERIMPSIEHSVPPARQPSSLRRATLDSQGTSPFPSSRSAKRVLDATSTTHAGGPAPKEPRVSRDVSRPATRDATTQTEDASRWSRELAGTLVEPFKLAIAKVVAAQNKALAETLPATIKAVVQQVLASEPAHSQSHSQSHSVFVRPQTLRPAAPEAALTRQAYTVYADPVSGNSQIVGTINYPFDDVRHVSRSDVRSLAGERLVDLSSYPFHRGGEQRRH